MPLFQKANAYDIVYNWFDYLKSQGHFINAYVIMPNHLHAIISFSHSTKKINTVIGNGKRFMAYELVKRMKEMKLDEALFATRSLVHKTDKQRGKKHDVFQPSFDWKLLESNKFIQQKLDYIHNNPVRYREQLCTQAADYKHSSALQYIHNKISAYEIKSVFEMTDVNLSGENY